MIYSALAAILAIGIWLRWRFIHTVHLYPDEFVSLLAIDMIKQSGLPVMPSGLFYEHGLLFSYLGSLASYLGSSHGTIRYVSLFCGGLTLGLTYWIGERWFSSAVGLMATAGLAVAPAAIHWSGRVRMYALLQLLVLLALFLVYEGIIERRAYLRWSALLTYLGATLAHFAAVALAPPLALAGMLISGFLPEAEGHERSKQPASSLKAHRLSSLKKYMPELLALAAILVIAFLVKRAGQPKGIDALEPSAQGAAAGLVQVFNIYSDFSINVAAGWQAISPFYLNLPALIYTPFVILSLLVSLMAFISFWQRRRVNRQQSDWAALAVPALFLGLILLTTTLEMVLFVSADRRDDKYLFMLLPLLFLLGAHGMATAGSISPIARRVPAAFSQTLAPLLVSALIVILSWPAVQVLLTNTGDDYDTAFAYVQQHWQAGDTILTGTPAAAVFYLGRSDFYGVQRHGGYDYRILTVDGEPVDRWLASPAVRTEAELHQTLADNKVWLVLERWGLQREYYDLPFQQQLLAQTDYVSEAQGIFILRSKPDPQPLRLKPAHPTQAVFAGIMQLHGYTIEPEQVWPGETLRLTLYWEALAPVEHNYTVFVHLRRPGGGNVAQADHRPLGNLYPTSLWPAGEIIRESSELSLPEDLAPGVYELWTGLYRLETGERLPVENDASGENAVNLGKLKVR